MAKNQADKRKEQRGSDSDIFVKHLLSAGVEEVTNGTQHMLHLPDAEQPYNSLAEVKEGKRISNIAGQSCSPTEELPELPDHTDQD